MRKIFLVLVVLLVSPWLFALDMIPFAENISDDNLVEYFSIIPFGEQKEATLYVGGDYSCQPQTHINSVATGIVSKVYNDPDFGGIVIIDYDDGIDIYSFLFGRLESIKVTEGEEVAQGQRIGRTSENLIHFEIILSL